MPAAPPDPARAGQVAAAGGQRPEHVAGERLSALAAATGATARRVGPTGTAADGPDADPVVTGVTLDSRAVRPGDLYAALPGSSVHGGRFVPQALALGARAVLTDPAGAATADGLLGPGTQGAPALVVQDPRAVLGEVAARVYGHPADDLLLLGVTGTNGKTTTCYLLEAALRAAGRPTGLVGTVETRIGQRRVPSVRTTPESPDLHALLAVMREHGVHTCAMEVSSHALALHRVDGIRYDVAAFTNLSQDHLDFHPDMEHYFAAKASLFTPARSRRAVVCVDDAWGRRLAQEATVPVVTVATPSGDAGRADAGGAADWRAADLRPADDGVGTGFVLRGPDGEAWHLTSPLPGGFNVANTAVAALVLHLAGLTPAEVASGLAGAGGVPGRMEVVQAGAGPTAPLAVVDYAHTPQAVAVALRALRPRTSGPLVVVLGAGGDRDPGKRGAMGAAAAQEADVVVVTDDNPRSEDPAAIRAAVLAGAGAAAAAARQQGRAVEVVEVAGRAEAVATAVARARRQAGGTVLVAGKGHETGQEVAGTVHPFDDRDVLARALTGAAPARAGGAR